MKLIKKSKKLNNVLYDIRGPIVDRAKEMEAQGQQLIKLNIGNLASFDFQVPEEIQRDMILNLPNSAATRQQGHLRRPQGRDALHAGARHQGRDARRHLSRQRRLGPHLARDERAARRRRRTPHPDARLSALDSHHEPLGRHPVHYLCDEENGWQPDLDDIRAKITPRTRGIVIINPNNPTGAVYPKETLLKLVDIAREFGLIIFADEVYDKILYEDAKHIAIASLSTDVLTITFNSLSKAYRACGYRAGWMIISGNKLPARDFIEGLNMLANMKLCANVPGQWAIQTALGGYQSINDLVCEGGRLRVQRDLAWELLTQIPGVTCVKPQGSLYMFPRLDPKIYPIENDRQFFKELLEATRVLLVQGTGFNWPHPDHFRVVFLPHEPQLREAISRIAEYLAAWRAAHPVKEEPATPRKKEGAAE